MDAGERIVHEGGCHCRSVRWRVEAPSSVVAWQCNCTDCSMRGNTHFVIPSERFKLLGDSRQFITTYTYGTHTAKHTFCKVCGITSFYIPRSNPDGVAITYRCLDAGTLTHVEIKQFDGKNWESSYSSTGIAACSKGYVSLCERNLFGLADNVLEYDNSPPAPARFCDRQ